MTVGLTGKAQRIVAPLAGLQIIDTSGYDGDPVLTFSFSVTDPRGKTGLAPRLLRLQRPAIAGGIDFPVSQEAGRFVGRARVPRSFFASDAGLSLSLEIDIPANAFAGQYAIELAVAVEKGE